ncbi:MAG TPA: hypothetical protein VNZ06_01415, partial [Steroidobacteraceae bacterium]|nr:hypothetical protein [Steroidobacteraceae bacterium]
MGVEVKLTDRELPASPAFIKFLAQTLRDRSWHSEVWADQRSEALSYSNDDLERQQCFEAAELVMQAASGRGWVARAYELLYCLMVGNLEPLWELQRRFRFVAIIGIARSGGSYLTAELYRAIGIAPDRVPGALAHDGFPDIGPFVLAPGGNSWTTSLKTMAEYLVMVEIFFDSRAVHEGKIVVPKKLTKGTYAGDFIQHSLGEDAEYLLTVRHPVAACVSTYEKSSGLPANGRFAVRSNIEGWCQRDLLHTGCGAQELVRMDYFDAYLRYWEHYHLCLVTSGFASAAKLRVVAFGDAALRSVAQSYHDRYDSARRAGEFHTS